METLLREQWPWAWETTLLQMPSMDPHVLVLFSHLLITLLQFPEDDICSLYRRHSHELLTSILSQRHDRHISSKRTNRSKRRVRYRWTSFCKPGCWSWRSDSCWRRRRELCTAIYRADGSDQIRSHAEVSTYEDHREDENTIVPYQSSHNRNYILANTEGGHYTDWGNHLEFQSI